MEKLLAFQVLKSTLNNPEEIKGRAPSINKLRPKALYLDC